MAGTVSGGGGGGAVCGIGTIGQMLLLCALFVLLSTCGNLAYTLVNEQAVVGTPEWYCPPVVPGAPYVVVGSGGADGGGGDARAVDPTLAGVGNVVVTKRGVANLNAHIPPALLRVTGGLGGKSAAAQPPPVGDEWHENEAFIRARGDGGIDTTPPSPPPMRVCTTPPPLLGDAQLHPTARKPLVSARPFVWLFIDGMSLDTAGRSYFEHLKRRCHVYQPATYSSHRETGALLASWFSGQPPTRFMRGDGNYTIAGDTLLDRILDAYPDTRIHYHGPSEPLPRVFAPRGCPPQFVDCDFVDERMYYRAWQRDVANDTTFDAPTLFPALRDRPGGFAKYIGDMVAAGDSVIVYTSVWDMFMHDNYYNMATRGMDHDWKRPISAMAVGFMADLDMVTRLMKKHKENVFILSSVHGEDHRGGGLSRVAFHGGHRIWKMFDGVIFVHSPKYVATVFQYNMTTTDVAPTLIRYFRQAHPPWASTGRAQDSTKQKNYHTLARNAEQLCNVKALRAGGGNGGGGDAQHTEESGSGTSQRHHEYNATLTECMAVFHRTDAKRYDDQIEALKSLQRGAIAHRSPESSAFAYATGAAVACVALALVYALNADAIARGAYTHVMLALLLYTVVFTRAVKFFSATSLDKVVYSNETTAGTVLFAMLMLLHADGALTALRTLARRLVLWDVCISWVTLYGTVFAFIAVSHDGVIDGMYFAYMPAALYIGILWYARRRRPGSDVHPVAATAEFALVLLYELTTDVAWLYVGGGGVGGAEYHALYVLLMVALVLHALYAWTRDTLELQAVVTLLLFTANRGNFSVRWMVLLYHAMHRQLLTPAISATSVLVSAEHATAMPRKRSGDGMEEVVAAARPSAAALHAGVYAQCVCCLLWSSWMAVYWTGMGINADRNPSVLAMHTGVRFFDAAAPSAALWSAVQRYGPLALFAIHYAETMRVVLRSHAPPSFKRAFTSRFVTMMALFACVAYCVDVFVLENMRELQMEMYREGAHVMLEVNCTLGMMVTVQALLLHSWSRRANGSGGGGGNIGGGVAAAAVAAAHKD